MLTVHGLRTIARRLETTFIGRSVGSFLALKGIDRAMAIAAQAFTALIPLVLLASALAPADRPELVSDVLIRKFHLAGSAADAMGQVFAHPAAASTGVFSVVLVVFSGVSLARRMQRMYQDAWQLTPRKGVRGSLNAALALSVLLVEIGVLALARTLVSALPAGWALGGTVSALGSVVLWTAVPWLLLDRRIGWRRLLPTGALTALCAGSYAVATTIYMPRQMETYSQRYGLFGVTLALVGWLLSISLIVVAATVAAAEIDRTQARWARRLPERSGLGRRGASGRPRVIPGHRAVRAQPRRCSLPARLTPPWWGGRAAAGEASSAPAADVAPPSSHVPRRPGLNRDVTDTPEAELLRSSSPCGAAGR